ncbi:nucleotide pyrophosphohydrolase [Desulfopila inferna]|uniref:nucleotide pyrophosphohydrolase n=1 Tax=Desulfopila inferna TaxID=468528 RepID=UPI001965A578|nr:nucleotide pyrophosphohydrolase [Desulfopila inferna]MBM9604112.1 nucleotide pyrophosphohydrolase [Desulfopila inferna]
MNEIKELTEEIVKFRDARDWEQFHNSKDLSIAINNEASELLDLFLWKDNEEFNADKMKEELADILIFSLLLAHKNKLDVKQIILDKVAKNGEKYPVEKAKGTAKKYTEL